MATVAVEKRKPVFVKGEDLKPGTTGHNLTIKVVSSKVVPTHKPAAPHRPSLNDLKPPLASPNASSETILPPLFSLPVTTKVDIMKPGATVIMRNAKIDMFKGSTRLAVDKWGCIEVAEPANFIVKKSNNLSLVEYELVTVQA